MKTISGLLAGCLVLGGCGSTSVVGSFEAFNADAEGRSGTIEFRDGRKADVHHVLAFADSTHFWNEGTGTATAVPTRTIRRIFFLNRFAGFLEGFGIGALGGGVAMLALSAFSPHTGEFSGADYVAFFALLGAAGGGVLGGIPGVIIGHTDDYQFFPGDESVP